MLYDHRTRAKPRSNLKRVEDVAAILNMPRHWVRYWVDQKKLVEPTYDEWGLHQEFTDEQVEILRQKRDSRRKAP